MTMKELWNDFNSVREARDFMPLKRGVFNKILPEVTLKDTREDRCARIQIYLAGGRYDLRWYLNSQDTILRAKAGETPAVQSMET